MTSFLREQELNCFPADVFVSPSYKLIASLLLYIY